MKCAPIPARKTLGDQAATVVGEQNIFLTPAAAALRNIDPTFPGSCNWSNSNAHSLKESISDGIGTSTTNKISMPFST